MEILYRSADLEVRRVAPEGAPIAVVTFDCYHDAPGFDRPAFGEHFLAHEGIGAIHLLARGNDWFQYGDLAAALAAVRHGAGGAPLLAYGSSMGAYAAIRCAHAIGAEAVLALSPQWSIDPRRAPFETRWIADQNRIRFLSAVDGPIRAVPRVVTVYDPRQREDRTHVERIAAEIAIEPVALPFAGHVTATFLSDVGLLRAIVLAMLAGEPLAPVAAEARARRKRSPMWLGEIAAHQPPHRIRLGVALAERAAALAPDNCAIIDGLAHRLRAAGDFDRAIALHRRAMELEPAPSYLWHASKTLFAAGRLSEATEIADRLAAAAPAVAGFHRWAAQLRLAQGDRRGAVRDLARAVAAAPHHRGYRLSLWRARLLAWLIG